MGLATPEGDKGEPARSCHYRPVEEKKLVSRSYILVLNLRLSVVQFDKEPFHKTRRMRLCLERQPRVR